jgi:hypothetical protein
MNPVKPSNPSASQPASAPAADSQRRRFLHLGGLAGAALPLLITLAPSEARAQGSGS